jgi:hypothetical protein
MVLLDFLQPGRSVIQESCQQHTRDAFSVYICRRTKHDIDTWSLHILTGTVTQFHVSLPQHQIMIRGSHIDSPSPGSRHSLRPVSPAEALHD